MNKLAFGILGILIVAAIVLTLFKPSPSKTSIPSTDSTSPTQSPNTLNQTEEFPKIEPIAQNLEVPWALTFLPDKSILVTERRGTVRMIDQNGALLPDLLITLPIVKQTGESGLHGIAIDSDFNTNHFVYLYYTYSGESNNTLNRVSKFKLENQSLIQEKIIVDQIPGATNHDGGRIKFGPDKSLYIATGDAQNPSLSQDKNSLAGKILRVGSDGQAVSGNPFNNLVYSYGHRNPQGLAWDKEGRLWATEHGQTATDELNLIEAGKNYGWPIVRGEEIRSGFTSPKKQSSSVTWAPGGAAIFEDSIFFAGLRGQALFEVNLNTLELKEHFKGQLGRIREVVLGPDNLLYITSSNKDGRGLPLGNDDKIYRVNPKKL